MTRDITEEEIVKVLTSGGVSLDAYFISTNEVPFYRTKEGTVHGLIVDEDDELANACIDYLRARGAPVIDLRDLNEP